MQIFYFLALLMMPVIVSACEGDCIVGITKVFLGNYTTNVLPQVFQASECELAEERYAEYPGTSRPCQSLTYMQPFFDELLHSNCYETLRAAIFPGYFHGKCLKNGVVPDGCPNPDCDVVCGTPGSLVHFYPKLMSIVFDNFMDAMKNVTNPQSEAYKKAEKMYLSRSDKRSLSTRMLRYSRSTSHPLGPELDARAISGSSYEKRAETAEKERFEGVVQRMPGQLKKACGGDKELAQCSWESSMKQYILSFP